MAKRGVKATERTALAEVPASPVLWLGRQHYLGWLLDDVLISVIEQFGQLSWAIRALIASYYQQIGANLAVEDWSSVVNRDGTTRGWWRHRQPALVTLQPRAKRTQPFLSAFHGKYEKKREIRKFSNKSSQFFLPHRWYSYPTSKGMSSMVIYRK